MASDSNFKFYIIGAGLPRTGTTSTNKALEILLPGKCMHMKMRDSSKCLHISNLEEFFGKGVSDKEFKEHFVNNNIVAGVDVPFILKYKQAMRVFPEAMVLLTVRDPESWVTSYKNTIGMAFNEQLFKKFPLNFFMWLFPSMLRMMNFLEGNHFCQEILQNVNSDNGVKFFNNYNAEVKAAVPTERIIIFNVKDDWKPLCEALDLPIPDVDFPRVNDAAGMKLQFQIMKVVTWGIFLAVPILIGYGLQRYFF